MTINLVIETVDELKPNVYAPERKKGWILDVEGRVNAEIVKGTYVAPADDAALLVPFPYDGVYLAYIEAQIAKYQLDYNEYSLLSIAFNKLFDDYATFYIRNNEPAQPNSISNIW